MDQQIGYLTNNNNYYSGLAYSNIESNRVLKLNINDLSTSNDKMIQSIDSTRKALKIAKNDLKSASRVSTVIKDTFRIEIPVIDTINIRENVCDFKVTKKFNDQTIITAERKLNYIDIIPDISNDQDLIISSKKEYRNKRKNFFDRLIHFDFKKDKITRYDIINSNKEYIKFSEVRIIEIVE